MFRISVGAALAATVAALSNGVGLTPGMGWSSWNHFQGAVSDALLRECADAIVDSGLLAAGYEYVNLDDGWAWNRTASGEIVPDPAKFPNGMKPVVDYIHSKGLKFGIYTARGSVTCMGRPGSNGYETQDAQTYAAWGVDYLKEDSCGGTTNGTVWEQYARMRDALNATGRPIYFSITEAVTWTDAYERMHCYGDGVFTVIPWWQQGLDPTTLANSALVEYCNNMDFFGSTAALDGPGGFLSNLDSQQLLTFDNFSQPGFWNDNDMLEVCNGGQTTAEYRSQFSTWAILASPLILGHDPRASTQDCLDIITNADVIAVNQDALGVRGKLVYQWPDAVYPLAPVADDPAPLPLAGLTMAPCNASDSRQLFSINTTDSTLRAASGQCVTYGGYHEDNVKVTACVAWNSPGIGSQLWTVSGSPATLGVVGNPGKVLDVFNCNVTAADSVQVCTAGGADCFGPGGSPAGCGNNNQLWTFGGAAGTPSVLSSILNGGAYCMAVAPIPPPAIILQVWAKPLANGDIAVLAFNRDVLPATANITMSMLGLPANATASFYDLWAHAQFGEYTSQVNVTVQPHDVVMLRATPAA